MSLLGRFVDAPTLHKGGFTELYKGFANLGCYRSEFVTLVQTNLFFRFRIFKMLVRFSKYDFWIPGEILDLYRKISFKKIKKTHVENVDFFFET